MNKGKPLIHEKGRMRMSLFNSSQCSPTKSGVSDGRIDGNYFGVQQLPLVIQSLIRQF
jgi:hypothetical protein